MIIMILTVITSLTSCSVLLNRAYSSYTGTYELLFEDLRLTYAYQDQLPTNYASLEQVKQAFASDVHDNMNDCEFTTVLSKVENAINDPHFSLSFPPDIPFECIELRTSYNPPFSGHTFLLNPSFPDEIFRSGIIDINDHLSAMPTSPIDRSAVIGYIRIDDLSLSFAGSGRLAGSRNWFAGINSIIEKLNAAKIQGLIIDVRTGAGGSQDNARFIASHFIQNARPYLIEKELTGRNRYRTNVLHVAPEGTHSYREGRILMLTDDRTCSGGEMYVLAMRIRTNLIQAGMPTAGCAGGIIGRDLANGWTYNVTSSQTSYYEFADGSGSEVSYLRTGIPPDETITPSEDPVTVFESPFILRALELITDTNQFNQVASRITRHNHP